MAAKSSGRSRSQTCVTFQDQMARKREREFLHQQRWNDCVRYYKGFDKANNKFEEWTSPRYYETNNHLIEKVKAERDKKQNLEKRREKLRHLMAEDEASYEIELMIKKAQSQVASKPKFQDIPTELLADVNVGLKLAEDDKRRHEAELKLYHQWRNNNPIVKEAERAKATKDLKLSWLDKQIEKRMAREKEQEECRRQLKERDKYIEMEKQREEELTEETTRKNKQLHDDILKQMEELKLKQQLSDDLRKQESEEFEKQRMIDELQEKYKMEEARRKNKECALFNVRQHKLKLRQRARDIEENLRHEVELAEQILRSEIAERIRDEEKRRDVMKTIKQFLEFSVEQRALEKRRQEYLDFIFDSEAKLMYEKQQYIWSQEQEARQILMNDVLNVIRSQIKNNIAQSRDEQKKVLCEREKMLRNIDNWEREMQEIKQWEEKQKEEIRKEIDEQVRVKKAKEKELKTLEKSRLDLALEGIKQEEERLKKEIIKIQNTHAPLRFGRKKPWY